jgi:uncharacterized membrane protein
MAAPTARTAVTPAAIFAEQEAEARSASAQVRLGLDWFSFVVSFKGVFLEGVEVVFIVITFGLNAGDVPVAIAGAVAAVVVVLALAVVIRRPLTQVPENTLKYGVGLLLTTFGTFWAVEGLGIFSHSGDSLSWVGGDLVILALLGGWFVLSRVLVATLRVPTAASGAAPLETSEV